MPNTYDVFQIEDNSSDLAICQITLTKKNLSFLGVSDLAGLRDFLVRGDNARTYIFDGKFPEKYPGEVKELVWDAIDLTRVRYPGAKIIIYSGSRKLREPAIQKGIDFVFKGTDSESKLVLLIQGEQNASRP